ncbi:unnamed protein product [Victoria cruziana]
MVAMGKSQKLSRRYSQNSGSNYRLETMGESDGAGLHNDVAHSDSGGFGSSGRIDAELTASEDSCAPKRKLMSLNVDRSDALGVSLEVFSIANMSRPERRELARKLKVQLEQVRGLQKKIASRCSNSVALSSSSGVRSCKPAVEKTAAVPSVSANGKGKTNKKASHADLPELSYGHVKNQTSAGKHGGGLKRGPSGRFESANTDAKKEKYKDLSVMTQCENLLKRLMTHQFGWVFNVPVDAVKLKIPDYFHIIRHPMDLGTIKSTLASGAYSSPHEFAADVRLTFSNAMTYNPPGNDVHFMADALSKFFEVRWKAVEKKMAAINAQTCGYQSSMRPAASDLAVSEQSQQVEKEKQPQPKKRKVSDANDKVKVESAKRIMSDAEKHKLSRDLENLTGDMLEHVVDFLRGHSQTTNQNGEDEIEIDIDSLSDDVLFTLRNLLDDYIKKSQEHQQKAELIDVEPTEVEVLNESGLSNYSLQPCKGNEPADEDVDIGGNDPPVSSYPPVEIEKDMVARGSKCSSSSSSSGDSASSSSDSDSGSSSGSESDGPKALSPVVATKETICSGPSLDQTGSEKFQTDDGSCPVSELAELEQNSQSKAFSSGADSQHEEGENAPSGRQVSPDKLYRAALLRSRFADTILKAREKTLDQGDKGDPEKLRREREELERKKREEKARLQAEAKAAEDARRQAEAAAAAEAKKRREREREAARLALQKVDTVESNYLLKCGLL